MGAHRHRWRWVDGDQLAADIQDSLTADDGPGEVLCVECGARQPVRVMAPCIVGGDVVRIEV